MTRKAQGSAFTNRYLLDKVRAVALANTRRDQELAGQKILGLVQMLVGPSAWTSLYVADGPTWRLAASRGDAACEFPTRFSPDRRLKNGPARPVFTPARRTRMGDARIPIPSPKGRPAGFLRIQTLAPAAGRFDPPTWRLLADIAREAAPLVAALSGLSPDATEPASSQTGSA